jgi:mono/diheme cytochrome c family protein
MPAFGSALNEREIKAILDYIKFTWPEDIRGNAVAKIEGGRRQLTASSSLRHPQHFTARSAAVAARC